MAVNGRDCLIDGETESTHQGKFITVALILTNI